MDNRKRHALYRRPFSRRGSMMLDAVISITLASSLMLIAIGWMHQTLKYSGMLKERQRYHHSLHQLESQLRFEVRSSKSIAMEGDDCLVIENLDGSSTRFTIESDAISKVQRRSNKVVSQDRFFIASTASASWQVNELPDWISLVVERVPIHAQTKAQPDSMPAAKLDSTENVNASPKADEGNVVDDFYEMPIDLNVRVGPNPWQSLDALGDEAESTGSKERP